MKTPTILLRPFEPSDAPEFAEAVRESAETVGLWMGWAHADYTTLQASEWIAMCRSGHAAGTAFEYGIFSADGELLGGAGLNLVNRLHQFCNLGYWVRRSREGQGIASSAVRQLREIGFREQGFHRIEIVVAVGNDASAAVARKVGAQLEGVATNRLLIHGKPHPALMFALLPDA